MMGQQQMRQSMAGMRTRLRSGMSGMGQSMAGTEIPLAVGHVGHGKPRPWTHSQGEGYV